MPLQLFPAVTRDDMREVAVIKREAYEVIESNSILFPVDLPDEPVVAKLEKGAKEPARSCFKVVDTELEAGQQIVAFAQWVVHDASNPAAPFQPVQLPAGVNVEACELMLNSVDRLKPKHMGDRPHVYLTTVITTPRHQRRGAASLVVQRCVEHAKSIRLPIYLDAMGDSHGLYLKHGFRDLELVETDLSKWGGKEIVCVWAMIREP